MAESGKPAAIDSPTGHLTSYLLEGTLNSMPAISSAMRERLLDVAQDLVQRRGLNAMSFQDLSNSVGIRKASVHHHFANKSEMVCALLFRYRKQFSKRVERILQAKSSGAAKLKAYLALFSETLQEEPHEKSCLCGMLAAELLSLREDTLEQVRGFFQDNTCVIAQILRYGRQDGTLSYRGDPTRFAGVILSSLEGALLISRCEGGPERLDSVLRMLLDLARAD
jgi:TetR/AcrR family transcriptional repressor of nem operon